MASRQELQERIDSLQEEQRLLEIQREIRELKKAKQAIPALGGLPTSPIKIDTPESTPESMPETGPEVTLGVDSKSTVDNKRKLSDLGPPLGETQGFETPPHSPNLGHYERVAPAMRVTATPAPRRGAGLSPFRSVNEDPAYASVVQSAEGKYVELHCYFCKGNALSSKGTATKTYFIRGGCGIRSHISLCHSNLFEGGFTNVLVMERCVRRKLTKKEMNAVDSRDHDAYKVVAVLAASASNKARETGGKDKAKQGVVLGEDPQFFTSHTKKPSPGLKAKNTAPGGPGKRAIPEQQQQQ